jgi:chorismate mutase-like protein
MEIDGWRRRIDELDSRLLELLNERARYSVEIGKIKKRLGLPIFSPERERKIFERLLAANTGPLSEAAVRRLFERIVDENRSLEKAVMMNGDDF